MAEYRVEELARLAGTSVRNVRVYQDRGLLAKPRKQGRVGIYSEAHLARLRIIGQLLQRGYTFANIAELLRAWESGGNLNDVLGFESALGDAWSDEVATYLTVPELGELIGKEPDPGETARAIALGLFEVEGDRLRVPSPRLLHAGVELIRTGMSVSEVLDIAAMLRSHVDVMATEMVRTVSDHILRTYAPKGMVFGEDVPAAAEVVRRVRPMAQQAVDAILAQAMARSIDREIGAHFAEVMELVRGASAEESA